MSPWRRSPLRQSGAGVDYATQFIKDHLDQEAAKYSASYKGATNTYQKATLSTLTSSLATGNASITVIRYARYGGDDGQEAFTATLAIKPITASSPHGPYQLVVTSICDSHPKAKIPLTESRVDLTLTATITISYVAKDHSLKSESLVNAAIPVLKLPIGLQLNRDGWYSIKNDSSSSDKPDPAYSPSSLEVRTADLQGGLFVLPDSSQFDSDATLYLSASVSVLEADDFGTRLSALSKSYGAEQQKIDDALTKYLAPADSTTTTPAASGKK